MKSAMKRILLLSIVLVTASLNAQNVDFAQIKAAVLAPFGVRVNSISPGGFDNGCTERFQQLYGEDTPLGRMGKGGQELGCAALFLASDASSYVTGHNLVVDGGFTIW